MRILGWFRRSAPPPVRLCFRCDHPADREWPVNGVVYGFCWLHADAMRLLILLSPQGPEPDPCKPCR